ncbi:MAG: single-stranded DNA-binding protein [Acidobacteriota bacterium]|nr:single-stranded DNA-binding protein [Acidobacteriota bacterium]
MSFNKIILVGNLGRDPELRYTPQGTAVCDFSIATNEKKRDKSGEMQDITTWFRVTTWGKQAENASKYLSKGKSVYIEGRLRMEEYTDRDGKTRFNLEVNASDMQFLSGGSGGGGENYSGGSSGGAANNEYSQANEFEAETAPAADTTHSPNDDDIPF